jgi:hypothetical protein
MAVIRKKGKAEASAPRSYDKKLHSELCDRAVKWLKNTKNCSFAIAELTTIVEERPDALGFGGEGSILIECKTSRADFKRDAKKYFRRKPEMGMGTFRYYLCPPDLIVEDEIPDFWGLLYCHPKQIKVIKKPVPIEPNHRAERDFLCSIVRRCSKIVNLSSI